MNEEIDIAEAVVRIVKRCTEEVLTCSGSAPTSVLAKEILEIIRNIKVNSP